MYSFVYIPPHTGVYLYIYHSILTKIYVVVFHGVLYPFSWNLLCLTSSFWCKSCHRCVASFYLGSHLPIRRIAAWLQRRHLLLPQRWQGPSLLHTHHWKLRGWWVSSYIMLPWLIVLLLLHWLWWDHRLRCWQMDCTSTHCFWWWYDTPPLVWWRQGVHWCVLPRIGRTLHPLIFPQFILPNCLCLLVWFHRRCG